MSIRGLACRLGKGAIVVNRPCDDGGAVVCPTINNSAKAGRDLQHRRIHPLAKGHIRVAHRIALLLGGRYDITLSLTSQFHSRQLPKAKALVEVIIHCVARLASDIAAIA